MMRFLVLALVACSTLAQANPGADLAARVADASGADAWSDVRKLSFTWTHHPSETERSFAWYPGEGSVTVTYGDEITDVPLNAIDSPELRKAHAAFVNDNYWMLFELHLDWDDGVTFTDLGERAVPGFDDLGSRRALEVRYTGEGGYTPGDAYVLYLGDDDRPVAWAFHRGGDSEPSLVTTRQDWRTEAQISFPTRFTTEDGETFISITAVEVETAEPNDD